MNWDHCQLPGGYMIEYDTYRDTYMLVYPHGNVQYLLWHPRGVSLDDWIGHVEKSANAMPGSFVEILKEAFDGKHRQTSQAFYGGTYQSSYQSTGGATQGHPLTATAAYAQCIATTKAAYARASATIQFSSSSKPHAPTLLKSEGLRVGEIIAWRAWMIVNETLRGVVVIEKIWMPEEPMQGDPADGYGIHAYKTPHGPLMDGYVDVHTFTEWVIGEVAMWGDIIEHEDGYRSEYAQVHSLVTWHPVVPQSTRKLISEKYLKPREVEINDNTY